MGISNDEGTFGSFRSSTFTIPSGYIENIASPNMKSLLY